MGKCSEREELSMAVDFKNSETRENLMRAFAGESQARNRYTIAAQIAKKQQLPAIEAVFLFTADQEREHAEQFYRLLSELNGESITVDGSYPVNTSESVSEQLRAAEHNEMEEFEDVYVHFAEKAQEEGFPRVAAQFRLTAAVEKTHADRFRLFAEMLEQGTMYHPGTETAYMCLNCGHIYYGADVPERCPLCKEEQGYFVRLDLAPFAK